MANIFVDWLFGELDNHDVESWQSRKYRAVYKIAQILGGGYSFFPSYEAEKLTIPQNQNSVAIIDGIVEYREPWLFGRWGRMVTKTRSSRFLHLDFGDGSNFHSVRVTFLNDKATQKKEKITEILRRSGFDIIN